MHPVFHPAVRSAAASAARAVFLIAACSLPALCVSPADGSSLDRLSNQTPFDSFRGLWFSRFEYTSASSITGMIDRAADLGITDVVFQVRGQGDALYTPGLEVRSERLYSQPVGFDPLRTALDAAHARGIKLHAWLNMMPIWNGTTAPQDPNHLYFQHPEYLVRDQNGNPQQLYSHYLIANPVLPEARAHIAAVAADIAARYEVDGIHMDYIRYINDRSRG